jgi:hypothetical protein
MHSFKNDKVDLPMGAVWLMALFQNIREDISAISLNVIITHKMVIER